MALTKISRGLLDTGVSDSSDATAITIDSSENVGIGTTSPAQKLDVSGHIKMTGTGTYMFGGDNEILVGQDASGYYFATGNQQDVSKPIYIGDNASMTIFNTGNAERMRIDSSGNVLVGTTSYNNDIAGIGFGSGNFLYATRSSNVAASFNRLSDDGNVIDFRQDASIVGVIAASGGDLIIGTGDTGIHFHDGVDSLIPWNTSTASYRDNAIDLGTSSYRFDDIYATNGTIQTSDQNEKNTITNSDLGLDFINRLSPKSYKFNGKTRTHYGLIAQDIETVLSDISKSTTDFAGFIKDDISEEQDGSSYRYGLRYNEFISPLIKAIQEQQELIKTQQTTINDLKSRIETLES